MTDVLVVEDQKALASALMVAIGAQQDLECALAVGSVEDALDELASHVPDVVLMDIELPGADGIEGTRRIKASYPEVKVLILTAVASQHRLAAATAAGAAGFLTKDTAFGDILRAIRTPADGKMIIEGTTLTTLPEDLRAEQPPQAIGPATRADDVAACAILTGRERQVLALMGEGLDPRSIAQALTVSLYTARGHVKNIMMKLGAHSQLEAVVVATRSGLIRAGTPEGAPEPHKQPEPRGDR